MTQHGFFFDMNRCYACQACSIACKDWNGLEPGAEKWMTVYEWEEGTFPNLRLHSLAFPAHIARTRRAQKRARMVRFTKRTSSGPFWSIKINAKAAASASPPARTVLRVLPPMSRVQR